MHSRQSLTQKMMKLFHVKHILQAPQLQDHCVVFIPTNCWKIYTSCDHEVNCVKVFYVHMEEDKEYFHNQNFIIGC